jgi:hypothetical protein
MRDSRPCSICFANLKARARRIIDDEDDKDDKEIEDRDIENW